MDKKNRYISVSYQLFSVADGQKKLEEQTADGQPFQFISGFGISLDAFEAQLIALETGSTFDFTLQPTEAFGEYDSQGMHKLGKDAFVVNGHFDSTNVYEGAVITLMNEEEQRFMARVLKVEDDGVTLDTNHPLAGKVLNFVGKVLENREATDQEVQSLIKHLTGGCGGCGGGCHDGCEGGGCGDGCGNCGK